LFDGQPMADRRIVEEGIKKKHFNNIFEYLSKSCSSAKEPYTPYYFRRLQMQALPIRHLKFFFTFNILRLICLGNNLFVYQILNSKKSNNVYGTLALAAATICCLFLQLYNI
jgi:hypothetical protein